MANATSTGFPRNWRWDEDGLRVEGRYVRLEEAPSEYGQRAIVVLDVGGEERAVWLAQAALRARFAAELKRRRAQEFEPGERIIIERGAEMKEAANGRSYWPFTVDFVDAPRRSAAAVLGVAAPIEPTLDDEPTRDDEPADDDIPF